MWLHFEPLPKTFFPWMLWLIQVSLEIVILVRQCQLSVLSLTLISEIWRSNQALKHSLVFSKSRFFKNWENVIYEFNPVRENKSLIFHVKIVSFIIFKLPK